MTLNQSLSRNPEVPLTCTSGIKYRKALPLLPNCSLSHVRFSRNPLVRKSTAQLGLFLTFQVITAPWNCRYHIPCCAVCKSLQQEDWKIWDDHSKNINLSLQTNVKVFWVDYEPPLFAHESGVMSLTKYIMKKELKSRRIHSKLSPGNTCQRTFTHLQTGTLQTR